MAELAQTHVSVDDATLRCEVLQQAPDEAAVDDLEGRHVAVPHHHGNGLQALYATVLLGRRGESDHRC